MTNDRKGDVLERHTDRHIVRHPWPAGTFLQFGRSGVVLKQEGGAYRTAFFEAFPDTFLRGEGETVDDAEDAAWAKFERITACDEHRFERRKYRNGAGICADCGMFASRVFDPTWWPPVNAGELASYCVLAHVSADYSAEIEDLESLFRATNNRDVREVILDEIEATCDRSDVARQLVRREAAEAFSELMALGVVDPHALRQASPLVQMIGALDNDKDAMIWTDKNAGR